MASGGTTIGSGKIDIYADIKAFDTAMGALPKKAADKMGAAMKAIEAKVAQTKLDMKVAVNSGSIAAIQQVTAQQDALAKKIEAVTNAAIKQARALQAAARATTPFISPQQAATSAAKVAATGQSMNSVWLDGQMAGQLEKVGEAGKKAGEKVRQGGSNGAMGLLVLSQTIDDAQYGLSAVVNNMPQVGMAIGQALGVSTEKAMAFGGAMGIAAVAIKTWVDNADHVQAIFGGSQSEDVKELADQLTKLSDTARSLFATLANLDGGFNWVSTTGKDVDALTKQMEDKEAFAKAKAKRTAANRDTVSGIKAEGADKRGKGFGDAVESFGGGDKLASAAVAKRLSKANLKPEEFDPWRHGDRKSFDAANAARAKTREQAIRDQVDADIVAAKGGDKAAAARLSADAPSLKGLITTHAPGAKEARTKAAAATKTAVRKTASSLEDTVGREMLKDPGMGMPELWGKVKEAMVKAGYTVKEIVDQLPSVAMKIKADTAAKIKEKAGKEGVDAEAARKMLLKEAAERDKQKVDSSPEGREAERLARSMEGGVGQRYLEGKTTDEGNLKREVGESMKKAGMSADEIGKLVDGTASRLKKNLDKAVQERAAERNISVGAAQAQLAKEGKERNDKAADRPKAEVMSTESYLSKVLVAGLSKGDNVPKEQLTEQKTTNKKLDAVIKSLAAPKKGTYATAAPGRA